MEPGDWFQAMKSESLWAGAVESSCMTIRVFSFPSAAINMATCSRWVTTSCRIVMPSFFWDLEYIHIYICIYIYIYTHTHTHRKAPVKSLSGNIKYMRNKHFVTVVLRH